MSSGGSDRLITPARRLASYLTHPVNDTVGAFSPAVLLIVNVPVFGLGDVVSPLAGANTSPIVQLWPAGKLD
jgi:hypothetical protein